MSHDGDDWGQCMAFRFAIAGTIYRNGGDIPQSWVYQPGVFEAEPPQDWPEVEIEEMFQSGLISMEDLIQAGEVFKRYSDILEAQGKDY